MTKYKIYKLTFNDIPVYVGQTTRSLKDRHKGPYGKHTEFLHMCQIELIINTNDVSLERYWIEEYTRRGYQLLNMTAGDGLDRKKYQKEYKQNNKEYFDEYGECYYDRNKEKILLKNNEYYKNNKEKMKEYHKEYYSENRDRLISDMKEYNEKNKEKLQEYRRAYYKEYNEKKKKSIGGNNI